METLTRLYQKAAAWLDSARGSEEGQTFIEYVLVIVVIVLALFLAYQNSTVTGAISNALADISSKIGTGNGTVTP